MCDSGLADVLASNGGRSGWECAAARMKGEVEMSRKWITGIVLAAALLGGAGSAWGAERLSESEMETARGGWPWAGTDCVSGAAGSVACLAGVIDTLGKGCGGGNGLGDCSNCPGGAGEACAAIRYYFFDIACTGRPAAVCAPTSNGWCDGFGGCTPVLGQPGAGCGTASRCAN